VIALPGLRDRFDQPLFSRHAVRQARWPNAEDGPEPYDVREKVLKLGLNSIYGKTAQSKGMRVTRGSDGVTRAMPPRLSNMFYAAAVTAGTRAMLLDAQSSSSRQTAYVLSANYPALKFLQRRRSGRGNNPCVNAACS
jgi:hypothetical protein